MNTTGRTTTHEPARRVGYDCIAAVTVHDVVAAKDHSCYGCDKPIPAGSESVESRRVGDAEGVFTVPYCTRSCRARWVK